LSTAVCSALSEVTRTTCAADADGLRVNADATTVTIATVMKEPGDFIRLPLEDDRGSGR
jgi:hypothetical protein